jgi:hypothetical protein
MLDHTTITALINQAKNKAPSPPLPTDPEDAVAMTLAQILDPNAPVVSGEIFKELARRNDALANAPTAEIQATLARQVCLLEAMATRLLQKAATTTNTSAASEFTRAALATERVLLQALGALHQMSQNQIQTLIVDGENRADVT